MNLESVCIPAREIFSEAIKCASNAIVVLHNHPSGDTTPSKEDIRATNRLRECGEILGIDLLDHIIIGDHTYMSMVEDGYFD